MTRGRHPDRRATPPISDDWLASVAASAAKAVQAPADLLGGYLPLLADAAINGRRPDAGELDAVRELGRRAAAQGGGARRAVDLYLSAAWRVLAAGARGGPPAEPGTGRASPRAGGAGV